MSLCPSAVEDIVPKHINNSICFSHSMMYQMFEKRLCLMKWRSRILFFFLVNHNDGKKTRMSVACLCDYWDQTSCSFKQPILFILEPASALGSDHFHWNDMQKHMSCSALTNMPSSLYRCCVNVCILACIIHKYCMFLRNNMTYEINYYSKIG